MKALVVVDYQNDHVVGPMSNRYTQLIENNICARVEETLKGKGKLFFVVDSFPQSYFLSAEGKGKQRYCIRGTPGAEIYGRLNDYLTKAQLIRKTAYGSEELAANLRQFDEIELCGVETENDILVNAVLAMTVNPKARIVIRQNCIATRNSALAEEALDIMAGLGIDIA